MSLRELCKRRKERFRRTHRQARGGGGGGSTTRAIQRGFGFGGSGRVFGTWVLIKGLFGRKTISGLRLRLFGGGGFDDDVFDVLDALSAASTGNKQFGIWMINIFECS